MVRTLGFLEASLSTAAVPAPGRPGCSAAAGHEADAVGGELALAGIFMGQAGLAGRSRRSGQRPSQFRPSSGTRRQRPERGLGRGSYG